MVARILRLLFIRRNRTSEAARQLGALGAKARKERERCRKRALCDEISDILGRPRIDWDHL